MGADRGSRLLGLLHTPKTTLLLPDSSKRHMAFSSLFFSLSVKCHSPVPWQWGSPGTASVSPIAALGWVKEGSHPTLSPQCWSPPSPLALECKEGMKKSLIGIFREQITFPLCSLPPHDLRPAAATLEKPLSQFYFIGKAYQRNCGILQGLK